jgi:sortase A
MARRPRRQRHDRLRGRGGRGRHALVAIVVVLAANAAVLTGAVSRPGDDTRVDARGDVAAAAVALAASAEPAVEADLDPLAGITLSSAPIPTEIDATAVLPTPEAPPTNPYEREPEIRHGRLEIPAIGLDQTLFEGVSLTAINRGPSHWPGTAMPGQLGNVVVAGHRTTYTRPFWDLQALQPGDELIFTMADGSRHVYALDRIEIVAPTDVHIVDQTRAHTATLFACHPRGSARQRIVGHFTMKPATQPVQITDTFQIRAPAGA